MLNQEKLIVKQFVKSFPVGQKENPLIAKAKLKYGRALEEMLKKRCFEEKDITKEQKKIVERLSHPLWGPIFYKKDNKIFVKTKVGEAVRILYSDVGEECKRIANLIAREYWKAGAHVSLIPYTSLQSKEHMDLIPEETATEMHPSARIYVQTFDARIFLGGDEDDEWVKGLEMKMKLGAPVSQYIYHMSDKRKMRWCVFGWPIEKKKYYVNPAFYRKVYLKSISATFGSFVKKTCKYYYNALYGKDKIRITANDGTDLSFSIKGRPVLVADGIMNEEKIKRGDFGLNIPDGEVFLAPCEHSANGDIVFDYVATHGFGLIRNLHIKFNNGKVVWFKASGDGTKRFKAFLDANTGEKDRIAELGIGTNPAAKFIGETIVDEKIFGSIHIAIGNNTGAYHGKNVASSHLDMIKIMNGKNGNIWADGKLIMKDGRPVKV